MNEETRRQLEALLDRQDYLKSKHDAEMKTAINAHGRLRAIIADQNRTNAQIADLIKSHIEIQPPRQIIH